MSARSRGAGLKIKRSRFNASTGDTIHDIDSSDALRIVETRGARPLYYAVAWGDYSFAFPIHGPYRETIEAAQRDCARLARKARAIVASRMSTSEAAPASEVQA